MKYPRVIGEFETLEAMHQGMSIARFGDGEFNIVRDRDCVSQFRNKKLKIEFENMLQIGSTEKCAVAIPPLDNPNRAKQHFWSDELASRYSRKYLNPQAKYYSSFITRPDNAPWIHAPEYYDRIIDLWRGKKITLVLGTERSLRSGIMPEAESIDCVWSVRRDAYDYVDELQDKIAELDNNCVVLCLGCTATALAYRMAGKYHMLDLGHVGGFLDAFQRGKDIFAKKDPMREPDENRIKKEK
jgi:hypothetical protein